MPTFSPPYHTSNPALNEAYHTFYNAVTATPTPTPTPTPEVLTWGDDDSIKPTPKVPVKRTKPEKVTIDKGTVLLRFFMAADCAGYLFFKIYYQHPSIGKFKSSNGVLIDVQNSPALEGNVVFLQGSSTSSRERMVIYNCGTKASAETYKALLLEAFLELTNSLRAENKLAPIFSNCDVYEL